jgi:xanthine dehydrogenase large subunit
VSFEFLLNGRPVRVGDLPARTTLADFLRGSGATGTKIGCAEGDCGACTVALVERDGHGRPTYRAINACIALLPMVAGREVVTVEGISAPDEALHPVQQAMVENYGSQCGYCTPGFVVSLFEGFYRDDLRPSAAADGGCSIDTPKISDQMCGNLCRCTGYRPIRDAALDAYCGARPAPDGHAERLKRDVPALAPLRHESTVDRFLRPTTLDALYDALAAHPDAKLVAGATEIGVEINKKNAPFPTLVSTEGVPTLSAIHRSPETWWIGGAATLTAVEEIVAPEIPALAKMLRVFASRQIRSRATLGGNLATASPIGDSAPLLLALDARLQLASRRGTRELPLDEFFLGYRKTALQPGEIVLGIEIPHAPAGTSRRADFLKVSKRRELDISIVAAAFVADLDARGHVLRARLAYGGVAATPVRARRAEAALIGRRLEEALDDVAALLDGEFQPIDDVRGRAGYRRGLVAGLFEKFVRGETSQAVDGDLAFERGERWTVDDPSRALAHDSAVGHVTGRALYADDVAQRRGDVASGPGGMLDVWPVLSPHACARIDRRDAAHARAMPGIHAVLFAEDIPGDNNVGPARHDEPLLAIDDVHYQGQLVALVVGESIAACRAAAAAVVVDYQPMPSIVGIQQALAAQSFHTEPHQLARGDVQAGLAAAPLRFEGDFESGGQEHFYLETQAAWAEPSPEGGEGGTVLVSSSTQHPSEIQAMVAHVLGLERHQVIARSTRMGGGFGGKETQGNAIAALVALAARVTGRAVRWQLDRDHDMTITGKRHPFHARFRVGHDEEGHLLAVDAELTADGGWSLDLSQAILDRALFHLDNAYYVPACRYRGRVAKTNVTSHTAFRGFGGPQGMLVIEEILDRVARRLGVPPEVIRERNLYRGSGETNTTHYDVEIGDDRIRRVWHEARDRARFDERRRAIEEWNLTHPNVKRGLAITPVKFGISFTMTHFNQGGALVLLYVDGTAQVNHGGTEMGQGLHTKVRGIVMRELGLAAEAVRVMPTTTEKVPNTSATAASAGADLNGAAVAAACRTLRERLEPVAARLREERRGAPFSFADLCARAHRDRVSLAATGYYATPGIHWSWEMPAPFLAGADADAATARPVGGRPFYYYVPAAAVTEVEVDGFTGMHRVLRVDLVEDVGDSLNPGVDRGQIEGGFVQGMGWLTREELVWKDDGHLASHSASTYAIPAWSDAPLDFRVTLLPAATQDGVVHGSKAVGEPPLMAAMSVREAIRDAVAAFGVPGGEVDLGCPATCEAIFAAIQRRPRRRAGTPTNEAHAASPKSVSSSSDHP